mgnify:FL=1
MTLIDFLKLDETDRAHTALALGFVYTRTASGRATLRLARRWVPSC